jgi:ornithine cyclodeaminase
MTSFPAPPVHLGPADVERRLTYRQATAAIEGVLRRGFDPADDPVRVHVPVRNGQVLLMPSDIGASTGVKLVTIAPGNETVGLPRIQGLYLLLDAVTLSPRATIDGAALTTLRTPAVSMAAVGPALLRTTDPAGVVIFGAGPQGRGHARALASVLDGHRPVERVTYVTRRPHAVRDELTLGGAEVLEAGTAAVDEAVAAADVVVCATTSRTPVLDSNLLAPGAVVLAIGAHEPDARELDAAVFGRAQVVVEDVENALRECGDVVLAIAEGALTVDDLVPLRLVVTGRCQLAADRPVVFKGSGMSWQDLAVAEALVAG